MILGKGIGKKNSQKPFIDNGIPSDLKLVGLNSIGTGKQMYTSGSQ